MRTDIMTDIETLGKDDNIIVFQIGACKFDINTGKILNTFDEIVDVRLEKNININGDTLLWWLNTDKELLTKLLNYGKYTEKEMFENFAKWIGYNNETFLWGNGILFDNRIIKSKMEHYGIEYPIFYRNDRDMRTLIELASMKVGIKSEKDFREKYKNNKYISHDGLEDVKSQIELLVNAYKILEL